MSRKHYALTMALAVVAAFAGALLASAVFSAPATAFARVVADTSQDGEPVRRRARPPAPAEARVVEGERDEARDKWEYCAVTRSQYLVSNRGNQYWIAYFRGGRVQVVDVEGGVTGNALSNAIFKLGEEGWEMVGEGALEVRTPENKALYFKRRKSQSL